MKTRELALATLAAALVVSAGGSGGPVRGWIPPACVRDPERRVLDPRLPCTVPLEVEVGDRRVTLRWHTAYVESILGDDFGGYKVWRWRVPAGYDSTMPEDPTAVAPDTSSYTLLQVIARRDTGAQYYPFDFDSVGGEWVFRDPEDLFTFTKASSIFIPPGGGRGDSVFFFRAVPRREAGPINGVPYVYAVTYFGRMIDTLFSSDTSTVYLTTDMSSKEPDPLGNFEFPVYTGGPPTDNVADVVVIPNPYSDHVSWEIMGERKIQFVNLPDRSRVEIYTVAGDLLKTLELDAGARGTGEVNTLDWNLRNEAGREVTSGIYIYRVVAPNGREKIGHFVIIR